LSQRYTDIFEISVKLQILFYIHQNLVL